MIATGLTSLYMEAHHWIETVFQVTCTKTVADRRLGSTGNIRDDVPCTDQNASLES